MEFSPRTYHTGLEIYDYSQRHESEHQLYIHPGRDGMEVSPRNYFTDSQLNDNPQPFEQDISHRRYQSDCRAYDAYNYSPDCGWDVPLNRPNEDTERFRFPSDEFYDIPYRRFDTVDESYHNYAPTYTRTAPFGNNHHDYGRNPNYIQSSYDENDVEKRQFIGKYGKTQRQ